MIELKVKAGAAAGACSGLIVWALVAYVPVFASGLPLPVAAVIPFACGWAGHVLAGYLAPHTPRPGLDADTAGPLLLAKGNDPTQELARPPRGLSRADMDRWLRAHPRPPAPPPPEAGTEAVTTIEVASGGIITGTATTTGTGQTDAVPVILSPGEPAGRPPIIDPGPPEAHP